MEVVIVNGISNAVGYMIDRNRMPSSVDGGFFDDAAMGSTAPYSIKENQWMDMGRWSVSFL